jgi:hypothetical protein
MVAVFRRLTVALLLVSACNGSWRAGSPDARDAAAPLVFDDAAAAAHADAPHVQPREAAVGHHPSDASAEAGDAAPDHHEVNADLADDVPEAADDGGPDVAP